MRDRKEMADIVFVDDYTKASGEEIRGQIYKMESLLNSYLTVLRQVREKGIMEGETADALDSFISGVSQIGAVSSDGGGIRDMGESTYRECANSVTRFNEADEYLY